MSRKILLLFLLVTGTSLCFFYFWTPFSRFSSSPNLIVITMDTTRSDRLKCYGYSKIHTPSLDQLAQEGILFEQAFTSSPITLPAHASLFTGLYPLTHGIRNNMGYYLPEQMTTMAECFQQEGYKTSAFVASIILDKQFGLAQGFETYNQEIPVGVLKKRAEKVFQEAQKWLNDHANEKFFMWIHLYDVHHPRNPPEPYAQQYTDPYDGEVAYMDAQIGKFVSFLKQKQLYEETALVVTADHGEALGDHGELTHGYFVYDETLHIPLIFKLAKSWEPGISRVSEQVRIIDIFPTILQLFKFPAIPRIHGQDLTPLIYGDLLRFKEKQTPLQQIHYGETFIPFCYYEFSPIQTLRTPHYKFHKEQNHEELYDLSQDAKEAKNLALQHPEITQRFRLLLQQLEAICSIAIPATLMEIVPENLAALQALGYSGNVRAYEKEKPLLSAKENFFVHTPLTMVFFDLITNRLEHAQKLLDPILNQFPDLEYALRYQGLIYLEQKKFAEASISFQRILNKSPNDLLTRLNLARSCFALDKRTQAFQEVNEVLRCAPQLQGAQHLLWTFYLKQNQTEKIVQEIEANKKIHEGLIWFWKGYFFRQEQKNQEAIQAFERVLLEPGTDPEFVCLAALEKGKIHKDLQQFSHAIESWKYGLQIVENDKKCLQQMVFLFQEQQQLEPARFYLLKLRELLPTDWEVLSSLLHLNFILQKTEENYHLIRVALTYEEFTSEHRITLIQGFIELQKWSDAIQELQSFLKKNPTCKEGWLLLGESYTQTGQKKSAIESFNQFLQFESEQNSLREEISQKIQQLKSQ